MDVEKMLKIENALGGVKKIQAMMTAFEVAYIDEMGSKNDSDSTNQFVWAFYALWDAIKVLDADLTELRDKPF